MKGLEVQTVRVTEYNYVCPLQGEAKKIPKHRIFGTEIYCQASRTNGLCPPKPPTLRSSAERFRGLGGSGGLVPGCVISCAQLWLVDVVSP